MTIGLSLFLAITGIGYLGVAGLRRARRQAAIPYLIAAVLGAQTLLWLLLPRVTDWAFPGWEVLRLSRVPTLWLAGLAVSLALSGEAWLHVAAGDTEGDALRLWVFPLLGLTFLATTPLAWLLGWALLDGFWLLAAARHGFDGERLSGGLVLRGLALLFLWGGTLPGVAQPALWWGLAALLRLALYPFTVERKPDTPLYLDWLHPLLAAHVLAHLAQPLPMGMQLWLALAAFITALRALLGAEEARRDRVAGALLLAGVSVGFVQPGTALPLLAVAAASAAWTLFHHAYGWERTRWPWLIPGAWSLAVLLGFPPSPQSYALWMALAHSSWVVLLVLLLTLLLALMAGVRELLRPLVAAPLAPTRPRQVAQGAGLLLLVVGTILGALTGGFTVAALGLGVWAVALVVGAVLTWQGTAWSERWRAARPWERLTDPGPFTHLLVRVAQQLLTLLHFMAGVIEGDGALLWSLVFLCLILVVGHSG